MARDDQQTTGATKGQPPLEQNAGTTTGADERVRPGRRSVDERQQAVLELFAGKATVDQLARRFGVKPETIESWRLEALEAMREGFRRGSKSPRERELERENSQLKAAVTESSIAQALLKRELEAARSANPSRPARSRR